MAPINMTLDLTVQLIPVIWGLVAAFAISGIALFACSEAPDGITHACAAFVSRTRRFRLVLDQVIGSRVRNAA